MPRADATSTEERAILVEGLTARDADGRVVARELSFEVAPGEVVGLVGRDAAARSTVLRAILAQVPADDGRMRVLGRPYSQMEDGTRRVGAFLGWGGDLDRRARDHVRLAAAVAGAGADRVDAVLEEAGLAERGATRLRHLPASARQRLGVAVATLLVEPEVVLLDDPSLTLDPDGVRWLRGLLRDLCAGGCAVLLACHPLSDVARDVDRVLALVDGRLAVDASPTELVEEAGAEVVIETPGAEVVAQRLQGAGAPDAHVEGDAVRASGVSVAAATSVAVESRVPVYGARLEEPTFEQALDRAVASAEPEPASSNGSTPHREEVPDEPAPDPGLADVAAPEGLGVVALVAPAPEQGTTTLAALLADVLREAADRRVVALGLSADAGRLAAAVPPDERSTLDLADLLGDLPTFDERSDIGPYASETPAGAWVVAGPAAGEALAAVDAEGLRALLGFLERDFDVVVLDVGEGLAEPVLRDVVRRATEVVVVGTPGAGDALAEGSLVLDVVEEERSEPSILVLNRVEASRASALADGLPDDAAVVPEDPGLVRALDRSDGVLAEAEPATRVALEHLARVVVERLG